MIFLGGFLLFSHSSSEWRPLVEIYRRLRTAPLLLVTCRPRVDLLTPGVGLQLIRCIGLGLQARPFARGGLKRPGGRCPALEGLKV